MKIVAEELELRVDQSPMRVRVCAPRVGGPYPGVVLYSEIFQLTGPIRRAMERLAGHGYVVAAPEIFHRVEPVGAVIPYDDAGRERGLAAARRTFVADHDRDRSSVLDWLARDPRVDSQRLGSMGFCIGGHLALRAALDARVGAVVACYPTGVHDGRLGADADAGTLNALSTSRARLLCIFGDADPHVPPAGRARIATALSHRGAAVQLRELPAEHAFMRDEGERYDSAASDAAWRLALEHFASSFAIQPRRGPAGSPGAVPLATHASRRREQVARRPTVTPGRPIHSSSSPVGALPMRVAEFALICPALGAMGCGGGPSNNQPPQGNSNPLTVSAGPLVNGVTWQLNRPIDITFDRAVEFSSVSLASLAVQTLHGGAPVNGSYEQGVDPVTGAIDSTVIRFRPHCPIAAGDHGGFQQGSNYVLIIRGADSTSFPVRAHDGATLESTVQVQFHTPSGTNPAILYYDTAVGPPRVVVRGRYGAPLDDANSTRFELGRSSPRRVELRAGASGALEVDPGSLALVFDGLPLNHYIAADNHVALIVEFEQAVNLSAENLERIELQYFGATWNSIPCRAEALIGCGRRGSTVRLRPLGTLPPSAPLRLVLAAGFSDFVGDEWLVDIVEALPLAGTTLQGSTGARVDALFESFSMGGVHPESMEDVESVLGAPRGFWGSGFIAGVATPDGVSRVRSKWYPVGLAGSVVGQPPEAPEFVFWGVDAQGHVRAAGGRVLLDPLIIGPVAPIALQAFAVSLASSEIADPAGLRAAQPAVLIGDRARLSPDPTTGQIIQPQIFNVDLAPGLAGLHLGYGCYLPGFTTDCSPWNLASLFPQGSGVTVEITPQSFELYTSVHRDMLDIDHRVTIRFDATRRDSLGRPDPAAAYSSSTGWASDVTLLSSAAWDFVRFEVQFELDVSGDGQLPQEPSPRIDFIKLGIDFRR